MRVELKWSEIIEDDDYKRRITEMLSTHLLKYTGTKTDEFLLRQQVFMTTRIKGNLYLIPGRRLQEFTGFR